MRKPCDSTSICAFKIMWLTEAVSGNDIILTTRTTYGHRTSFTSKKFKWGGELAQRMGSVRTVIELIFFNYFLFFETEKNIKNIETKLFNNNFRFESTRLTTGMSLCCFLKFQMLGVISKINIILTKRKAFASCRTVSKRLQRL